MLGWNKDSRPHSAPPGHVIHYHSASIKDAGPAHSIVVTDHSTLLKQLGAWHSNFDVAKTMSFMRACKRAANGCVLYHFRIDKPDYEIIKAIGEMLKSC